MSNNTVAGRIMIPTIPSIMFIFGVVGNVIAIVVLCKSRKEQKETTFYTLVCGLAVTDLLGTLLASPVTIATYVKGSWPGGEPLCQYFGFIMLFFSLAGLSIICAMSVERYLAINHAYFYNDYVDQRLAGMTLLAIYISNVLFCALPSMGLGQVKKQYPQTWCFIEWRSNVQVFLNQIYKTPVELRLEKNPDLRAIRFASFNPILDPWIYILLRKAVLLKLTEQIKCLFCKIGARRQQRQGAQNGHCIDEHQLHSIISSQEFPSLVSRELKEVSSTSQVVLYLPDGSCHHTGEQVGLRNSSVQDPQSSYLSEQRSTQDGRKEVINLTRDHSGVGEKTRLFMCC
eukprot:XP_014017238.1 PREDICTED: prostaglandin E2 receptor EP4 subtype-like isoform X3 [Salmo salar]